MPHDSCCQMDEGQDLEGGIGPFAPANLDGRRRPRNWEMLPIANGSPVSTVLGSERSASILP